MSFRVLLLATSMVLSAIPAWVRAQGSGRQPPPFVHITMDTGWTPATGGSGLANVGHAVEVNVGDPLPSFRLGGCLGSQVQEENVSKSIPSYASFPATGPTAACPHDDGVTIVQQQQIPGTVPRVQVVLSLAIERPIGADASLHVATSALASLVGPSWVSLAPTQIASVHVSREVAAPAGAHFLQVTLVRGPYASSQSDGLLPLGETENYHLVVVPGLGGVLAATLTPHAPWQGATTAVPTKRRSPGR